MNCLKSITGALTPVMIHGTVLSILFARAISMAAALNGFGNMSDGVGCKGAVGVVSKGHLSAGVINGELKQTK